MLTRTSGSFRTRTFCNRRSPEKSLVRQPSQHALQQGVHSSPASLSGSLTDIPVLLVNGAPQPDLQIQSPGPENDLMQTNSVPNSRPFPLHSKSRQSFAARASWHGGTCTVTLTFLSGCVGFQASFNGSQPSMKFVMDTSKYWFRPHVSRAEGETFFFFPFSNDSNKLYEETS